MRTIKFRGKRIDNGEWVYGYYTRHSSYCGDGVSAIENKDGDYRVVPETIGQWTGFLDMNNVEIYEDDIVMSGHLVGDEWVSSSAVIEWDAAYGMFVQRLCTPHEGLEQLMDVPCNVIGNIHDKEEYHEG